MIRMLALALLAATPFRPDPRVDAVIAAIGSYERSVPTLYWTQRHYQPPCDRGDEHEVLGEWTALWEERFAAEDWTWFLWKPGRVRAAPAPPSADRLYFGTAGLRVVYGAERH